MAPEVDPTTMPEREGEAGSDSAIGAGALAGLLGGIAMALAAMIRADAVGAGFWLPMKNIAATWYGVESLIAGADAVFFGIVTHLVVATIWGAIYGYVVGRNSSIGISLILGLAYGAVIWLLMTYLVLPTFNDTMAARVALQPFWYWFGLHLLFGGSVGIFAPAFARAMAREPTPERTESTAERPEGEPA